MRPSRLVGFCALLWIAALAHPLVLRAQDSEILGGTHVGGPVRASVSLGQFWFDTAGFGKRKGPVVLGELGLRGQRVSAGYLVEFGNSGTFTSVRGSWLHLRHGSSAGLAGIDLQVLPVFMSGGRIGAYWPINRDGRRVCSGWATSASGFDVRLIRSPLITLVFAPALAFAQPDQRTLSRDRSKPVPSKDEIIAAWQKRQSAITTFRFAWTEEQTRPARWLSNPRYPERDRTAIPGLLVDRHYVVAKTLAVADNRMRYSFTLDRKAEPDGVREIDPGGRRDGLGVRRHYSYLSVFDGQIGESRLTSLEDTPPPTSIRTTANVDAQNLDVRPFLLALRPLDPVMGHLLIDRAVTNEGRTFYKGKSTFLLEERHDPMGWKTILTIEPERDFLISRYVLLFEQKAIVDMDIDYIQDARWGWVPSGWRLTAMLADGTRRLVSVARVTSYEINAPIATDEFSWASSPSGFDDKR